MIEADQLSKRFESFQAVDSVSFNVASGEVMALLGPNGAGKTTTVRMLTSVLKPSAKIAQGFETQWFKPEKGELVEGFVTRESGDEVELRNVQGETRVLKKPDIQRRGKRDFSTMPEGLAANLTPEEFANLLAYVESLKGK